MYLRLIFAACFFIAEKDLNVPGDLPGITASTNDTTFHFVDSINVGRRRHNKIEFTKINTNDSNLMVINFYGRSSLNKWKCIQQFRFECDNPFYDPRFADFNNDGFKDATYISATAARGANEVRKLFIYDKDKDRLVYIINSEDYPNMQYNSTLNCIDAWLFHGGCSTVFVKLKGDRLVEFASVNNDSHRTVYEIDKYGNQKLLRRDSIIILREGLYVRYKNYKPLVPYKE